MFQKNIKDYRIKNKIGTGAFGSVCKAEHPKYGTVALKKLRKEAFNQLKAQRETENLKLISTTCNKHIVKYFDSFSVNGNYYIAVEYCDGGDLRKVITRMRKTKRSLEKKIVLDYIFQISSGIRELHMNYRFVDYYVCIPYDWLIRI
jgi:serine/threonine protein kinase